MKASHCLKSQLAVQQAVQQAVQVRVQRRGLDRWQFVLLYYRHKQRSGLRQ